MTAETVIETQARASSPKHTKQMKRPLVADTNGLYEKAAAAEIAPRRAKSVKRMVANNGWGELFKNRENFVEMHLC